MDEYTREFGAFVVELEINRLYISDQEVGGVFGDWDQCIVSRSAIEDQPLAEAAEALGAIANEWAGGEAEWFLSERDDPLNYDDPKVDGSISVRSLDDCTLAAQARLGVFQYDDEEFEKRVVALVAPMLKSENAELWKLMPDPDEGGELCLVIHFPNPQSLKVRDLVRLGEDARALALALRGGPVGFKSALNLLRAGHPKALVGQREGLWLDAKSEPYDLKAEYSAYLLARLVSAFANSEGGLIVLPASTTYIGGAEEISQVKDVDIGLIDVSSVRNTIGEWVYPRVDGLEVEVVATSDDRGYMFIHVPKQAPADWPTLVYRAEVAGKNRGEVAIVFERHGDQVRAIDVGQLHAMLKRGRANGSSAA